MSILAIQTKRSYAQLITVDGNYFDKKGNPIVNARVLIERDQTVLDEDQTDAEGNFLLDILLVNVTDFNISNNTLQVYPNPFRIRTNIDINSQDPGSIYIQDLSGNILHKSDLKSPGSYLFEWGADDLPRGLYLLSLISENSILSKKVLVLDPGYESVKLIDHYPKKPEDHHKQKNFELDTLKFLKQNTTPILKQIDLTGDTTIIQTGNAGPKITQQIQDEIAEMNEVLQWNAFDYHYNDDLSELTTGVTGASIIGDSIYQFIVPNEGGIYQQILHITDPEDPSLKKIMVWNINVDQPEIPPDANDDFYDLFEGDQGVPLDVTDNDQDLDGTIEQVEIITPLNYGNTSITDLIIFADLDPDYNGLDSLKYRITDNDGLTDEAWAYLNIQPVDDAPFPTNPFNTTYTITEGAILELTVRPDHYDDIDSEFLTYIFNNLGSATGNQIDGESITITPPNDDWNGTISGISIDAFDGNSTATSNAFDLVVTPEDDEPVQTSNIPTQTSDEDQQGQIDLESYYSHADGDILNITDIAGLPAGSSYNVNQDQATITFPDYYNTDEYSSIDNVVITAEDSDGDPLIFNGFEWVINPFNNPIVVNDDNYPAIPYNTPTDLDVKVNDTDIDLFGGPDGSSIIITQQPTNGTATVVNGKIRFTSNVSGPDSFEYQISDLGYPLPATSGTATVDVIVETQGNVDPVFSDLPDQNVDEDRTVPYVLINDLDAFASDANGDDLTYTVISQTNPTLANVDVSGLELILDFLELNQYGTSTIGVEVSDGQGGADTSYFTLTVDAVNDTIVVNDDNYSSIAHNTQTDLPVLDNDNDDADGGEGGVNAGSLSIITAPEHATAQAVGGVIQLTSTVAGLDSLQYEVSDTGYPLPPTTESAWVYFNVESAGNQDPTINLPDKDVDEDRSTPYTLFANLDDFSFDGDGDDITYRVISQTNTTLANVELQSLTQLVLTYLEQDGYGSSTIGVEADDGNGGLDTAYFELTVNPKADITFIAKWLMDQTNITGGTLHVGSNQYTINGSLTMQVDAGTQQVNLTHPNSIDNTSIWPAYLIIQTPGQNANIEQRAGDDPNSPITFGTADKTYNLYKIRNTFDMFNVSWAIGTGPNGETIRFAWNPNNPTAYFDESGTNQTPNSTTVQRVQDGIAAIADATLGKLDLVYDQGSNPPSTPYLEMAINTSFPQPSNGTTWDGNYEITFCSAHWPNNMSAPVIWEEIIQATQNSVDVGQSLTTLNGSTWEISNFGKACLRLGYNLNPGTKFVNSSRSNNDQGIEKGKALVPYNEDKVETKNRNNPTTATPMSFKVPVISKEALLKALR